MPPPTPLKSKKCSLCGKRKPLSAYLTTEKNGKQLHGSVCNNCLGIDGRFLSLHILRKKIQQLLGKFGSSGLFNKNDDEDSGDGGDGSWDPEDRGKSKEYRLNLDAEELGAEAKQHKKLAGEKMEAETKAQKKEHKQSKIEKEKKQEKQSDTLDEKTEKEKEEKEEKEKEKEKLEQEAKDEKTTEREKKQDKKKLANANKERLFSSFLQKNSNAQRSYGQNKPSNETNNQTSKTSNLKETSQISKAQENQTTTAATTNTQQQKSSNTAQASSQQSASSSTQATNTTTNQQNQHGKQQQQNATAFYKQNPNVADQFADLSNVTIRNTVPTSVSAGTVRLFQQANMDKGKAGAAAHQEARQKGKQATAKGEADQLKKAMQISMKSWK
jgi:hypothetical protein